MASSRGALRQWSVALRTLVVLTIVCGVLYPLLVTGVAQVIAPAQANGGLLERDGETVGSALLGQSFTDADGAALPQYFQSRPSAAGDGYDGAGSSGSNAGPESADLLAAIEERRAAVAALEGVDPADVPADALTASASGLDPHISPEYALLQVPRIAAERDLTEDEVTALVEAHTAPAVLGYLSEPAVAVLPLNLALDEASA